MKVVRVMFIWSLMPIPFVDWGPSRCYFESRPIAIGKWWPPHR